ncbi:extracellular solute-binding protein [Paenibacillus filicis]|uniref:Extracellular solute-binding protein n=1 Tax=Paenibacillus gyeongsangnamensis TaxID=3388067 RepID=A0ABT4QAQ5_9BACL|nr:extracellular solute-binding protein [Paenibacillus filicis]MCZ8513832.1 extracellular solute-binding protein [Paenibacillus filicis]
MNSKMNKRVALSTALILTCGTLAACGGGAGGKNAAPAKEDAGPTNISIAMTQVGDIPAKDNEVQQLIEKYTNTKLDIQWIPNAAYNDKVNVMIASNDLPKMLKVQYNPNIVSSLRSDQFWEVGPYLKDYKNLSAQNKLFYDNISVDGKIYGVPNFSDMGRASVVYRKDWLDALGLKLPTTIDEWYNVTKSMTLNDPDKNGKNDTYGLMLFKKYNEGAYSLTTRLATSLGAPNKWAVDKDSNFTPEFMTKEYNDVLKLFKRLYDEKLINQDFAVFDSTEADKLFDSGRAGLKVAVAQTGKSQADRLSKNDPKAVVDVEPIKGPQGIRVSGEPGNSGFYVFPKSSVKTEAELRKLLAFEDKMMDPDAATLLMRGVENKHYVKTSDNKTEYKDFTAFQREVKPYRDNFPYVEGFNVLPLKDTPIGEKGVNIAKENNKYIVPNPALTLTSATYNDRGSEIDQMIADAQTNFIMGKIDDAAYQGEIDKWKKAGGDKIMAEYKADYLKTRKK